MSKFYITTAILYTNGPPHVGFALELLQADVLARYHRLIGDDTFFLTGTDEHGATVVKGAQKANRDVKEFVDEIASQAQELTRVLNISNDDFIRTSDQRRHWPTVQKIWQQLDDKEDLYKKNYKGFYCVGHESFVKKSDLDRDGFCPLHKTAPEEVEEENWFFKLTKYTKEVRKKIENEEIKIVPDTRKSEVLNLLNDAEDISFSRPSKDITWGVPVPGDSSQTVYVWGDALTNYLSALGYVENDTKFNRYWPANIHLIGKDILRFHALYWPAMLMSAGLLLPKSIYVHGFITVDGQKMSKTVGNVIDPFKLVEKYGSTSSPQAGTDIVRYFLLREIPSGEDGDFSEKRLVERYNGELANGLGNLVSRVATLIENNLNGELVFKKNTKYKIQDTNYSSAIEEFRLHDAVGEIWKLIAEANQYIDEKKPWVEVKENPDKFLETMTVLIGMIHNIAYLLQPFMPETAQKIAEVFGDDLTNKEISEHYKFLVKKSEPLFPRLK